MLPSRRVEVGSVVVEDSYLVGEQWRRPLATGSIEVRDPGSGELLLRVPAGEAADIDVGVRAAQEAFRVWSRLPVRERVSRLDAWASLLTQWGPEIATLESMEVGRPYAGPSDVGRTVRYYAGLADKLTGLTLPGSRPDVLAFTRREPLGVCGSIVPWNAPAVLMMKSVAPALAAGNAMVVKPAEDAPLTCMLIGRLALDAGLPPGLLTVIPGYGATAGHALATHPGIRHLSFTGSAAIGAAVMRDCAQHLIPLHLELGGKSPQILLRDADLDTAVASVIRFLTRNAGQICYAGTRLLVDRTIHRAVVDAVVAGMRQIRVGRWTDEPDMGPLISQRQAARVLDYIELGREEGARLLTGGGQLTGPDHDGGNFVEPTVFDDVDPGMRIATEEIFGPVLSVLPFDDPADAIEVANGTEYGLSASVWTSDLTAAMSMAERLECGQVYLNTYGSSAAVGAPFGGYKKSGFGRTDGADAILDYTQVKSVLVDYSR